MLHCDELSQVSTLKDQRAEESSQTFWSTIRHGASPTPRAKTGMMTPRMSQKKTQQIWQNLHNAKEEAFMKAAQMSQQQHGGSTTVTYLGKVTNIEQGPPSGLRLCILFSL